LGPTPIADEKCCDTSPSSDYGRASGRVTSLVTDPTTSATVYAGSAGGGVWKSINSGSTWSALTDTQASLAIGALAIDASGKVLFAGTGEDNDCIDCQPGVGILKSTDGGTSWSLLNPGGVFTGTFIGGLAVDRTTKGTTLHVFAATQVGLYMSTDAGSTWTQKLAGSVMEIKQDPTAAGSFWAVSTDFCGVQGGIQLSTDSGKTWKSVFTSPQTASRISLGVGSGGVAYAALANCSPSNTPTGNLIGVEKSTNYGGSWSMISVNSVPGLTNYFDPSGSGSAQGWYDNVVAVDPTNSSRAVFGGETMLATTNGGSSFSDIGKSYNSGFIHADFHALAFTGANSFYTGNDGGVWKTTDLGGTGTSADWTNLNAGLSTIQFYSGAARDVNNYLGGAQDNGSAGSLPGAPSRPAWQEYHGGDGGDTAIDPVSDDIYAEYPHLVIEHGHSTLTTSSSSPYDSFQKASPCAGTWGMGKGGAEPACNNNGTEPSAFSPAPFLMDPTNPSRLLAATNKVYESSSGGLPAGTQGYTLTCLGPCGWTLISSGALTDPSNAGDYISAMAMGQTGSSVNTIVTGSDAGTIFLTTNDGGTNGTGWTNISGVSPTNLPTNHIGGIAINPKNSAELWVAEDTTYAAYVWHTMNATCGTGCTTWSALSGTDAQGTSVVVDPYNLAIYVATHAGVRVCTTCYGAAASPNWANLGTALPSVWVYSLTLTQDGTDHLVAWTHGRGAWMLPVLPAANWVQRFPGVAPPAPAIGMAFDVATNNTVALIGRCCNNYSCYDETWAWDGLSWTKLNPASSPPDRCDTTMVYDDAIKKVVLWGGHQITLYNTTYYTDTWTWDGTTWSQVPTTPAPGTNSLYGTLAYDWATGKAVLFGGEYGTNAANRCCQFYNETWQFDGTNWAKAQPLTSPSGRSGFDMKYDGASLKLVLFGGANQTCSTSNHGGTTCNDVYLNDTWTWDGATWTKQNPASSPPARNADGMAYDSQTGKIIIFGGQYYTCSTQNCQVLLGDTWSWDGTTWSQEQPANSPSARVYPRMDYDFRVEQVLLFGAGQAWTSVNPTSTDTWNWSHGG